MNPEDGCSRSEATTEPLGAHRPVPLPTSRSPSLPSRSTFPGVAQPSGRLTTDTHPAPRRAPGGAAPRPLLGLVVRPTSRRCAPPVGPFLRMTLQLEPGLLMMSSSPARVVGCRFLSQAATTLPITTSVGSSVACSRRFRLFEVRASVRPLPMVTATADRGADARASHPDPVTLRPPTTSRRRGCGGGLRPRCHRHLDLRFRCSALARSGCPSTEGKPLWTPRRARLRRGCHASGSSAGASELMRDNPDALFIFVRCGGARLWRAGPRPHTPHQGPPWTLDLVGPRPHDLARAAAPRPQLASAQLRRRSASWMPQTTS